MELKDAIEIAKKARLNARVADSNYPVGSCLVTKSGKAYSGCNVENCGLQSICAERTAFVKALSEGENDFSYIVVVGAEKNANVLDNCLPCGYCRQFMVQYVDEDFKVYTCFGEEGIIEEYSINDLLPHAFKF